MPAIKELIPHTYLVIFFKIISQKILQEYYQSVKRFGFQIRTDLGPNCLHSYQGTEKVGRQGKR